MGVTAIKEVVNRSPHVVHIVNTENPTKFMNGGDVPALGTLAVDIWIPWVPNEWDLRQHHIRIAVGDDYDRRRNFALYQRADVDGDFVRLHQAGRDGTAGLTRARVGGDSTVDGNRRMIVSADGDISLERI